MRRRTLFHMWSPKLMEDLPRIHEFLLQNRLDEAAQLYNKSAQMIPDAVEREIKRERHFIHVVSDSRQYGSEESQFGLSPRQALLSAALSGWRGDTPCSWISPATRDTIIAWGESHYGGPTAHLERAFTALELEGLFFEVHPTTFFPPAYYCCLDSDFIEELPDVVGEHELWDGLVEEYDEEHGFTWRRTGICAGQGSQGPSDWGPCLGPSCVWFQEGNESCNHDLSFNQRSQSLIVKERLMLSYGEPDELFAERLCMALEAKGVRTWFFPRDAEPGAKLRHVIRQGVNNHDRVVLICSRDSLQMKEVTNEIEQALARESREGGSAVLLPITTDDFIFSEWSPQDPDKKQELLDRIVADFRKAATDQAEFDKQVERFVAALRVDRDEPL